MLDQNTDRMWFVIGAVIVGAAIIFIANGTLPTLFASVSESFEESSTEATSFIDFQSTNLVNPYMVTKENQLYRDRGTIGNVDGFGPYHAVTGHMPVEGDTSYTLVVPGHTHTTTVVYYDVNKNHISGTTVRGLSEYPTVSPENARYARTSNRILGVGSVPVEEWWFGKTEDAPKY